MSREPLTFREKELWWEIGSAAVVLVLFPLLSWLRPVRDGWTYLMLMVMWFAPMFYFTLNLHTGATERTDEREREIDAKGDLAGLRLLALGVTALIVYAPAMSSTVTVKELVGALLVLLCLVQMFRAGWKLRAYAGHEGFWPDGWIARRRAKGWRRLADRTSDEEARARWLAMADELEAKARR